MANKKQSPVVVFILIAIIVVAAIFFVRALQPPVDPARAEFEYLICTREGCPFRIRTEMMVGPVEACPQCEAPVMFEGMEPPPPE